jgi:hypothetical protein
MLNAVDDAAKVVPRSAPGITPYDVHQKTHEDIMPGAADAPGCSSGAIR